MPRVLRDRALAEPNSLALIDAITDRKITLKEFHDEIQCWSRRLAASGVQPGDNVATLLGPTFDAYNAWMGLCGLSAVEVPINPQLKGRTLVYLLNHSQSRLLLTHATFLDNLVEVRDELECLESVVVLDSADAAGLCDLGQIEVIGAEQFHGREVEVDFHYAERHDTACIIYTSGTTGPPKGVVVPWGRMITKNLHLPDRMRVNGGTRYSYLSPAHMSGKGALNTATGEGRTLVLRETFSVSAFWEDVKRYDCRVSQLFPPMIKYLLAQPPAEADANTPLEHIWTAPVIPETRDFMERFGVAVSTGFGMTEIGGPIAGVDIDGSKLASCGKINPDPRGYEARIVDEYDQDVPVGEVGEFIVRTSVPWSLNSGYFRDPEATAAAWRNGWFHTGDALKQDEEGNYYFVDRKKDAIRRKGENISSFEVEGYVREAPGVTDAAAVGVSSDDGEQEVKVFVVADLDATLDLDQLGQWLAEKMPRFMVPRYLEIVDELPRTPATGRVQKGVLRAQPSGERSWDRLAG
jgi:crotonobetaine/carnitine-CoA ligase